MSKADSKYSVGELYFRLTYPDAGMRYPKIETFVFVGKNLGSEDTEDTWYFQFADSYAKHGSILETTGGDRRVSRATRRDLGDMLDQEGLARELHLAAARRKG